MLTLPSRTIGDAVVLPDTDTPRKVWAFAQPRLARDPDGRPRLSLTHWQLPDEAGASAGGRLWLELSLALGEEHRRAIARELGEVEIAQVPWLSAELVIAGPETPAVTIPLGLADPTRAVAWLDLAPRAAAELAAALRTLGAQALQTSWTGRAHALLPGVEIRAHADVDAVRRESRLLGRGAPALALRTLIEAHAKISITGPVLGEALAPLRRWALDRLCAAWDGARPLAVELALGHVVELPLSVSGTLDDTLTPAERDALVTVVDLDADVFLRSVDLEVRVVAPFGDEVVRVEVELALAAGPTRQMIFSDGAPQRWSEHVGDADRSWRWRARAVRRDRTDAWGAWEDGSASGALLVAIPRTRPLAVEVIAAALDLAGAWHSVRIELVHEAAGVVTRGEVVLDRRQRASRWAPPGVAAGGSVQARLFYASARGGELVRGPVAVDAGLLVVGDPLADATISVALVPAGTGWADVTGAMIDLRYVDGDYRIDETLPLSGAGELVTWRVAVREDGPRALQWRAHVGFADGRFESRPWGAAEPGTIIVRVDAPDRRVLRVLPVVFDPALHAEARVRVQLGDATHELVVGSRAGASVTLPPGPYRWSCTWSLRDGSRIDVAGDERDADVLVLLPPAR